MEPYSCLKGCYASKFNHMTSHKAVVVNCTVFEQWGPYLGTQVNIFGFRKY